MITRKTTKIMSQILIDALEGIKQLVSFYDCPEDVDHAKIRDIIKEALEQFHASKDKGGEEDRGCPCKYLDQPCNPNCTCVNGASSIGCMYCATYGNIKQRKEKAKKIADWIKKGMQHKPGDMQWVSVKDKPLFIQKKVGWICTDEGSKEFIAAVPYTDQKQPGKELWWIKHCVVEDEIGLCVVGDVDNEPAGWELSDVTHYILLPDNPPKI